MSVIRDLFAHRRHVETAFVLGGGGNLGAVQVGMLRALLERQITPDLVIGCSVGAINGAALAADPTVAGAMRIWDCWSRLGGDDIFPHGRLHGPWQLVRRGEALFVNDGLRRVIEDWLPYRKFEETKVPLEIVAVSLRTEQDVWFSSGPVVEPVLASAALPAVFPPVWIDGEAFIDGGVVNNVPLMRAVELGAKRIFVLHCGNFERERPHPQRPLDVLIRAFSIARSYRFKRDGNLIPDGVEIVTLPGIDPGPVRYNDLSHSVEIMDRAHTAASSFLDARTAVASGT